MKRFLSIPCRRVALLPVALLAALLPAMLLTSCESASPGGDAGYVAPQPMTPIDRATYMQDRIGQITRSSVR